MTTPSDAQLATIAGEIFILRDRSTTRLPKPVNTGPQAFTDAMDLVATDARWTAASIGVIDFTAFPTHPPNVWLHNPDEPYRIGSAAKIAMMLAAMQLRLEVRRILKLSPQIVSTAAEFDALFSNRNLWKKGKLSAQEIKEIGDSPPLISKIFDFTKSPVDFAGPDPNAQTVPANQTAILNKLTGGHLTWETTPPLDFSERLWLAGAVSDNVAATACVSAIGVPYLKSVQRSYGLAEHPNGGMHLFSSGLHTNIPSSTKPPPPRQLAYVDPIKVDDKWLTGANRDKSWVPGSAAALTAYMLALVGESFIVDPAVLVAGQEGCTTIRNNLSDGGALALPSFLVDGPDRDHVADGVSSITTITTQFNKIGILRHKDGAENPLLCEFVYLETKEVPPPAAPHRSVMKYAVIVVGLVSSMTSGPNTAEKSAALGIAIHNALLKL